MLTAAGEHSKFIISLSVHPNPSWYAHAASAQLLQCTNSIFNINLILNYIVSIFKIIISKTMNGYTRTGTPVPHQHRACAVRVSCRPCPCPWTMRHPHQQRTTHNLQQRRQYSTKRRRKRRRVELSRGVPWLDDWLLTSMAIWCPASWDDVQLVRDYQIHTVRSRLLQALIDALLHFLFYYCHHRPSGEYNNNIECIVSGECDEGSLSLFSIINIGISSMTCVHQITLKLQQQQQQQQYCECEMNHSSTLIIGTNWR